MSKTFIYASDFLMQFVSHTAVLDVAEIQLKSVTKNLILSNYTSVCAAKWTH